MKKSWKCRFGMHASPPIVADADLPEPVSCTRCGVSYDPRPRQGLWGGSGNDGGGWGDGGGGGDGGGAGF